MITTPECMKVYAAFCCLAVSYLLAHKPDQLYRNVASRDGRCYLDGGGTKHAPVGWTLNLMHQCTICTHHGTYGAGRLLTGGLK